MENPFKLISSKEVYKNPWIEVREDLVVRPGGSEGIFGVVTMVPGVVILPITADDEVYLTEEFRYAIARGSLETIGGAIDQGETPLQAAKRELREEAGLVAEKWTELSFVNPFTTIINSPNYMFLAEGLEETERDPDDGEQIEVVKMPFAEALDKVMQGEVAHAASCVAILKAAQLKNS